MKKSYKLIALIVFLALSCGLISYAEAKSGKVTQELEYRNISVTLDGKTLDLRNAVGETVEPFMFGGTNYLPVRALAESLGLNVAWNGQTATVVLTTPSPVPPDESKVSSVMQSVDAMEGLDFEYWTAALLRQIGFSRIEVTQASGDKGVDVLAEKDGIRYAVQCKRYSSSLGNDPVQEVVSGKAVYHTHVGAVITNQSFTSGARDLAEANCVLLWDRAWIEGKLKELEAKGVNIAFSADRPEAKDTPSTVTEPVPAAPETPVIKETVEPVPTISETPANPDPFAPVNPVTQEPDKSAPASQNASKSAPVSSETNGTPSGSGNGDNFNYWDLPENQQTDARYVLNNSTMKIHNPDCREVKKIAPQNYGTSNSSYDALIAQGYTGCGICTPH